MNCSSVDLKAYFLGETARAEKSSVEDHVRACQGCREELDHLKLTEAALRTLPDEEAPQRIAFVSDKVFVKCRIGSQCRGTHGYILPSSGGWYPYVFHSRNGDDHRRQGWQLVYIWA